MTKPANNSVDVAIVGGGLSGLTAATILARAGRSVVVFEKAPEAGGRAVTHQLGEFHFNIGPHALFRGARQILKELDIQYSGKKVGFSGNLAYQGELYRVPSDLLGNKLLGLREKIELVKIFARLGKIEPRTIAHLTIAQWLDQEVHYPRVRQLMIALARVFTYTNSPDRLSAGVFVNQFKLGGVYYLDGGWQTLVDGLQRAAQTAGAEIRVGSRGAAIEPSGSGYNIRQADGTGLEAGAVIIAAGPEVASTLVENGQNPSLKGWAEACQPVQAACLDVALHHLPQPDCTLAIGVDQPLYFSVHSRYARLGPQGSAVIHLAKYLEPGVVSDPKADERELEAWLDLAQPGWRAVLAERRFMPHMVVYNAMVTATEGGLTGRPGPQVPGLPGLYIAGDWVGPRGLLTDAALASAKQAAEMILSHSPAAEATRPGLLEVGG